MRIHHLIIFLITGGMNLASAQEDSSTSHLYVATGTCYSGQGITTPYPSQASNTIYRVNTQTGQQTEGFVTDYFSLDSKSGDSPVSLIVNNDKTLYVLVQNANHGLRRLEKVEAKWQGKRELVSYDPAVFSNKVTHITLDNRGDLLISKSSAIEKLDKNYFYRILNGYNAYIQAPAGACKTSTTNITRMGTLRNGIIYFLHSYQGQNRIAFVRENGYAKESDCVTSIPSPDPLASPTAAVYDENNDILIVAYGGSNAGPNVNSIYAYKLALSAQSVNIAASEKLYDRVDFPNTHRFLLYGISAMELDQERNHLYVASLPAISQVATFYKVEKLSYDPKQIGWKNHLVLNQASPNTFIPSGSANRCISDFALGK